MKLILGLSAALCALVLPCGASPAVVDDVDGRLFAASTECLTYLAAGSTAESGEHADAVRRGLDLVLRDLGSPDFTRSGRSGFTSAFPVIFLAEMLYDESKIKDPAKRKVIMEKLQHAVNVFEAGQKEGIGEAHGTDGTGAWGYSIAEGKGHGRRKAQASVCCLIALIAARDAGAKVSDNALKMGVDYLLRCVHSSGEVGYQGPATDGKYAGYGRTAGALYVFTRMEKTKTAEYARALKWLDAQKVDKDYEAHAGAFQAWGFVWGGLFHAIRGGESAKTYFAYAGAFFKDVVKPDGTWNGKAWEFKQTIFNNAGTHCSLLGALFNKGNIKVLMKK